MSEEVNTERMETLECLKDANKRLQDAEAAKKRDTKIHGENIKSIKEEISEILDQLKGVGED